MTALFLYTQVMKDRFWTVYFYVMWSFFVIWAGRLASWWFDSRNYYESAWQPDFPILVLLLVMTIIRYIATGKHFWNRP